jgi:hypothetical protein
MRDNRPIVDPHTGIINLKYNSVYGEAEYYMYRYNLALEYDRQGAAKFYLNYVIKLIYLRTLKKHCT